MSELAPIALFTYKRVETLKRVIYSLQKNFLSPESELFIFSDAAKTELDILKVREVRDYLKTISGFKKVIIYEEPKNKGLANSIIGGVSKVISEYGKVIVLEDDLVTSQNFLSFMNQSLDYYQSKSMAFSISGFTMPIKGLENDDLYFTQRASSWGWATWKDRWSSIDWEIADYESFVKNKAVRSRFNKMGSDMSNMLDRQMKGKINSWAIRWGYHQFKHELFTVYPAVSKVLNIGLENPESTHTNERFNRFKTVLDKSDNEIFNFQDNIQLNKVIIQQFIRPYSIPVRIKYKILNSIFSR